MTNENSKTKKVTVTTATIDFGDWKITATGVLGEFYDWNIFAIRSDWVMNEHFSDQDELEAWMWEEVERLNKKYSSCIFEETIEEVENEDYEEEEE